MKAVCEHGVKYEPIIQEMYCRDKNTSILEFGSIRHQDKELSIITASPDGITPTGNMLETTATNNDITVQGKTEAFVEQEGVTTVSAHKLFEIVMLIIPDVHFRCSWFRPEHRTRRAD